MSFTIKCPMCGQQVDVPADVVSDGEAGTVEAILDRTPANEHLKVCPGRVNLPAANLPAKTDQPKVDLAHPAVKARLKGRIDVFLDQRHYAAKGKRACHLCGAANEDCMTTLEKRAEACCGGCHNGDTHPVPGGDIACSEWGSVHGAKD